MKSGQTGPRSFWCVDLPTADHELLAAAFQAAVKKARELGWIA